MNNLDSSSSTDLQDETPIYNTSLGQSIEDNSSVEGQQSPRLICLKPGCEGLQFSSELQHHNHILTHITLPTVKVPRLVLNRSKQDSLKVRLKLTSGVGSNKPAFENFLANLWEKKSKESADQRLSFSDELCQSDFQCFEVVPSKKFLSGPGGLYCLNGISEEVKTEFTEETFALLKEGSSARKPASQIELDGPNFSAAPEETEETAQNSDQEEEEDSYQDEEDPENDLEEEEEDELDDEEGEESGKGEAGRETLASPSSPTPSEVLRPRGFLAPEQLVDDDSCYPRSPPVSPTRMVEMNGSTSAVSGSDNDSGHSRSPATFTGGSGAGSGGEEDSSVQQGYIWDALIGESSGHGSNESDASNENGRSDGSPAGEVNDRTSNMDVRTVVSNILDSDPLMLPENSVSAEGEQENLNLLQNLTADPLQAEADRGAGGETEYMSLDRLGEASFCCEVCGERAQDRRVLEEHRVMAGHYKCLIMPECGSIVWGTASELAAHQSSIHGVNQSQVQQSQRSPQQQSTPPQTSPQGAPGTPPVQQLAQQVQRLPIPQQTGYMPSGQYPQPQMPSQMGQMMSQMGPLPGQMPHRRPPMGYRVPMVPGQPPPYGPGSPNQPGFSGAIQPRPLNTLVAPQPRGQGSNRLPPGAVMPPRGMVSMPMRGQKRPGPVPQNAGRGMVPPPAKQRRGDGMMPPQQDNGPGKKSDAKAVANILATRGITVTPAGAIRGGAPPPVAQVRQPRQNMLAPAPPPPPVTTLNLNSAISIIPTTGSGNGRQQNNSGFAVPQVRSAGRQPVASNVERPPRPPTVDLTGEGPILPPGSTRLQMGPTFHRGRGRPSNISRTTCQICDKVFASAEMLNQHMAMHRGPGKLPFRCNLCNAQYPTNQGLQQHRQTYHKESIGMSAPLAPGEEMVIPLIDLKQPGVAARLSSLGIHHCIPLSGLGNQANGYFSLPVVSIDGSRPSAAGNLRSLGASGVLSIGPIKLVPK